MVDVLIIGGGPAGSSAALRLARAGWEVLLVDRARFPRRKACGEYYNPEATRILADLKVMERLWSAGAAPVPRLVMAAPEAAGLSVGFSELPNAGEGAFTLGREELDSLLVDEARRAGAAVWEGTEARGPLVEGGQVRGATVERDGTTVEVRARVTLAADGLRSRFARKLGLGLGDGGRRKFGIAARGEVSGEGLVEMRSGGPGCCGVVVRGQEANFGMVAGEEWLGEMGGDPSGFFRRQLRRFPGLAERVKLLPERVLTVGPLTWKTWRQHTAGCLLLGDAAGYYDPFTGQGVTFALQTAELAARVTSEALLERDVSERKLAAYSRARSLCVTPRVWVQQVIQSVLARPGLRTPVLNHLARRPEATRRLIAVIADLAPPQRLLTPGFLRSLV